MTGKEFAKRYKEIQPEVRRAIAAAGDKVLASHPELTRDQRKATMLSGAVFAQASKRLMADVQLLCPKLTVIQALQAIALGGEAEAKALEAAMKVLKEAGLE